MKSHKKSIVANYIEKVINTGNIELIPQFISSGKLILLMMHFVLIL